jgi:hypothetical protein
MRTPGSDLLMGLSIPTPAALSRSTDSVRASVQSITASPYTLLPSAPVAVSGLLQRLAAVAASAAGRRHNAGLVFRRLMTCDARRLLKADGSERGNLFKRLSSGLVETLSKLCR